MNDLKPIRVLLSPLASEAMRRRAEEFFPGVPIGTDAEIEPDDWYVLTEGKLDVVTVTIALDGSG